MRTLVRGLFVFSALLTLALTGCSSDDGGTPAAPTAVASATVTLPPASATQTRAATAAATSTGVPPATSTAVPAATNTPETEPTETPEAENSATPTPAAETPTPTPADATPTPTPTQGGNSYVGDYYGAFSSGQVRFDVAADGSASGFLDFFAAGFAAAARGGAAQTISVSFPMSGEANLDTGAFAMTGSFGGSSTFQVDGVLPNGPGATGTFSYKVGEFVETGDLTAGPPPATQTPTPTPGCDTADLATAFSNVSGDYNGISSDFVVSRMVGASEGPSPNPGEYNVLMNGTECTQEGVRLRNIQISIFGIAGGLASGQSYPLGGTTIVYYGEEGTGGDRVWSSSAGTVFIDSVQGSVVQLRVVGAVMNQPIGAAAGSFTLDVAGQVNNFTRND